MSESDELVRLAQAAAEAIPGFFDTAGAGVGNRRTNEFMKGLRRSVENSLGSGYAEQRISGDNRLAVDFFVPNEATIIEVALSLRNSNTEFERDVLKALMAQEMGCPVKRLLFVSKPGATKRHEQPSSRAIVEWVERNHNISIEIRELSRRDFP